jgi:hypothetical protein
MRRRNRQRGTTTVEFAIVGGVLFTILFAIIEFGRVVFTLNMLQEGARRAARVAAVCSMDNGAIKAATKVSPRVDPSGNAEVQYLTEDGTPTQEFAQVRYVRVSIRNYEISIGIPFIDITTFTAPEFEATLPRESLGVTREGPTTLCR